MVTGRVRKMVCPVMKRESKGGDVDQTWKTRVMVTDWQMIMGFNDGSVGGFSEVSEIQSQEVSYWE